MKPMRGFTLIEMAIVLIVITLLIGGLAAPLSAQIQARRIAETRADMNAIRDALVGYAMSHTISRTCNCNYGSSPTAVGDPLSSTTCPVMIACPSTDPTGTGTLTQTYLGHFLPCPDNASPPTGVEASRDGSGRCPVPVRGTLPWRTLGLKGHDAWGNRYTYAVTRQYANDQSGFVSTPAATGGDVNVFPDATCSVATVAENVPIVVVSHGPNGRGAQNMGGGTPLAAADLPNDERHNLIASEAVAPCNDRSFVSRAPTETFDDQVLWVSANELFNRVCPPGGCP